MAQIQVYTEATFKKVRHFYNSCWGGSQTISITYKDLVKTLDRAKLDIPDETYVVRNE